MKALFTFIQVLFFIFLALFLIGGVAIVATQALGVITLNGAIVTGVKAWLAPATFTCATLCAVCAFILNYAPRSLR
ncbi:hypothetical protein G7Y31_02825 [Corynebacterium lizhenjunii]|uniref:Uncharacterized protein n=1 Tax=Corynebacterium lizhenjunii TaxID=2709394 RepID=A0A7T0KFI1_9CORY|nr:hypothetical protein [Corynebacterium lizhenjunii]QPK79657.1 hypothetical protein G7Y31_02825 [Corynebacterium lizhenjunii]